MFADAVIVILGAVLLGGVLWWYRRKPGVSRSGRLGAAKASGRRLAARTGGWWHDVALPRLRRLAVRAGLVAAEQPGWEPAEPPPARIGAPPPPGPLPPPVPPPLEPVPARAPGAPPADHAAVQARIAGFEPEDDAALLAFYADEMAAAGGYAQAWEAHAEVLANAIGLDPAFTHVAAQLAESAGELGHDFAMVRARLGQVYGEVQQWVADGGVLPYRARDWLTGEGAQ